MILRLAWTETFVCFFQMDDTVEYKSQNCQHKKSDDIPFLCHWSFWSCVSSPLRPVPVYTCITNRIHFTANVYGYVTTYTGHRLCRCRIPKMI